MSGSETSPAPGSAEGRPFGVWTAAALVVGGMIGAGVFVMPAQLAPYGWTGVAGWSVAIPGAMLLAFVLSQLATARPAASGAVVIVGEALGPLPGVLVGWSYWVGICSANAIIALTAVRYGATFVPALTATPLATALGATTLIWALTALNLGGAKGAGRFQVVTTLLKLLPLFAVVLILLGLTFTDAARFSAHPHAPFDATKLTTVLTLCFFPLVGFEAASLAAERVRDPARNVLRATLYGTALTGLLYVAIGNGVVFALPAALVAGSDAPIALFVEQFWGRGAGLAIAAFASIAAIGCLNGWTLMQGEVPLGMARSGLMPPFLGRTSDRDVPTVAILLSSAFASALVLSGAIPGLTGVLTFMLQLTTAATVWLYVGACAAALALGIARPFAAVGLVFAAWVLWGSGTEALLLSIALMLTAIPLYWLRPAQIEEPV
ncbi:APC family permease [Sphingomonas sp. SUN039]|uniref:APC family permease n=1 Tax=Sphingomonas sp. SUN039 TaxID=2937787 RepID=UPI002164E582|nr:amino acid permease [Sphingomonas sp. SUN039]UVO52818.1 amino acid permease [Sphingomonas sp. SUN039]